MAITSSTRPFWRRWALRVALVAGSSAGGLLALELALRIYVELIEPKVMCWDDDLGWRHGAGLEKRYRNEYGEEPLMRTNAYGHRGSAYPHERSSGKRRVLVLGDSFAEAVQVEEDQLFTRLLERESADLEVINTGVGGWGTVQQLLYWRKSGRSFRPDLVVLLFFSNDLYDNAMPFSAGLAPRPHAVLRDGAVELVERPDPDPYLEFGPPLPLASVLARHSLLYFVVRDRIYQPLYAPELQDAERAWMDRVGIEDRFVIFDRLLAQLRDDVASAGAQLLVALAPSLEQIEGRKVEVLERVESLCRLREVSVHSLIESLRAAHRAGERPYFAKDIHWSARGHEIVAASLAPSLRAGTQPRAD